jgi:hypothetical protein
MRLLLYVSTGLRFGLTLGCSRSAKAPVQESSPARSDATRAATPAPQIEAQQPANVPPADTAQAQAKAKELADLAAAAVVNATFKRLPGLALAHPEEYNLECAVLDASLDDKPKTAYAEGRSGWRDRIELMEIHCPFSIGTV